MSTADHLREITRALDWADQLKAKLDPADVPNVDQQIKRLRKQLAKGLTKYLDSLEAQKLSPIMGDPGPGLPTV